MAVFSQYPTKLYLLAHCFACKETLRMPMHCMQQRHYGMARVHSGCFHEELFAALSTDHIVVLESKSERLTERTPTRINPNAHKMRYFDTMRKGPQRVT